MQRRPKRYRGAAVIQATRMYRARRPHQCELCGWSPPRLLSDQAESACGKKLILAVHHILRYSEGGDESDDNLILLCPNHHALADAVSQLWRSHTKRGDAHRYVAKPTKHHLMTLLPLMEQHPQDWMDRYDPRDNTVHDPKDRIGVALVGVAF